MIENLKTQMTSKGKEINDYREKYNIRFQNETNNENTDPEKQKGDGAKTSKSSGGVLVANN
jgi:prefoldin subunit 2